MFNQITKLKFNKLKIKISAKKKLLKNISFSFSVAIQLQ